MGEQWMPALMANSSISPTWWILIINFYVAASKLIKLWQFLNTCAVIVEVRLSIWSMWTEALNKSHSHIVKLSGLYNISGHKQKAKMINKLWGKALGMGSSTVGV